MTMTKQTTSTTTGNASTKTTTGDPRRPVRIDGLQICNFDRAVLLESQAGGIVAINATCAVWEGPTETVQTIGRWYQLLRNNADIARLATTIDDIDASISDGKVAMMIGFQNASPFADDYTLVEVFHRLGVRVAQLTYNMQNLVGGACYDASDNGLTPFGRIIIEEMNRVGMVVDLSHVGNRTSLDAVEASSQPVAITHANPLSYFDTPRNKPDEVIDAVAASGGIVGLCLYPNVIGGAEATLQGFCQMAVDLAERIGIEHVALASDSVRGWSDEYLAFLRNGHWRPAATESAAGTPSLSWPQWPPWFTSPADFGNLAEGLSGVGMSDADVAAVMGTNWYDYFARVFRGEQRR